MDTMPLSEWAALTMPDDAAAELLARTIERAAQIAPDTRLSREDWDALFAFTAGAVWHGMQQQVAA